MGGVATSPRYRYSAEDRARFVTENPKSPVRTDFERDRARVVHSSALRRLGAKTQVMGPMSDDFVRTRLTHSLEVAQVGRELGKELGCDPDIVDAACLSHDVGHPPFGHNGERALNAAAAPIGGFEGNAQTLRIVTRLEAKVLTAEGGPAGLNLTRATLDAIAKYPWARAKGPDRQRSLRKYGVYPEDAEVFEWLREDSPPLRRSIEAQIMDLSDDIAYSVHDVEDGVTTGRIVLTRLGEDVDAIIASTLAWYGSQASPFELERALERLTAARYWPRSFDGSYADRAFLKDLTSQLIGRFCVATVTATRDRFGDDPLGRFSADLVVPRDTRTEILALKGLAVHYVMRPREHDPMYLRQRTLIADLVDALMRGGAREMEEPYASDFRAAPDAGARLRAVIDQVASLTDLSARRLHAKLCGMFSAM